VGHRADLEVLGKGKILCHVGTGTQSLYRLRFPVSTWLKMEMCTASDGCYFGREKCRLIYCINEDFLKIVSLFNGHALYITTKKNFRLKYLHRDNLRINNQQDTSRIQNFILSRNSTCPKHVEFRGKIKFWILDVSCWLFIRRQQTSWRNWHNGNT
jgi:hypothetical protein